MGSLFKEDTMALKTICLTPGCQYTTHITKDGITVNIRFPNNIDFDNREAKILECLLHNSIECVLRPYFMKNSKRETLKNVIKGLSYVFHRT